MAEVLTGVNGQILRWARENYNMTPGETAAAIGVDEARYLRWENGEEFPTYAKLKKVSEVLISQALSFSSPSRRRSTMSRGICVPCLGRCLIA